MCQTSQVLQQQPAEPHAAGRSQDAAPFVWVIIPFFYINIGRKTIRSMYGLLFEPNKGQTLAFKTFFQGFRPSAAAEEKLQLFQTRRLPAASVAHF
jgi:hypothetical protein